MNTHKYSFALGIAFAGVLVFGLVRFGMSLGQPSVRAATGSESATGAKIENGVQRVTIGFSDSTFNYEPEVIRLKKGVPAEITLDTTSLNGCMSVLISRDLKLQAVAEPGNNVIKFTPEKTGKFAFSCPMGMGAGTFIVEG